MLIKIMHTLHTHDLMGLEISEGAFRSAKLVYYSLVSHEEFKNSLFRCLGITYVCLQCSRRFLLCSIYACYQT